LIYVVKALVRDDGEQNRRGTGNINLKIYGATLGGKEDKLLNSVRLYGPFYEGIDRDNSLKYEWRDYFGMRYSRFAIVDLKYLRYKAITIVATEGDYSSAAKHVVFHMTIPLYRLPKGKVVKIEGSCDTSGMCATLWLCRIEGITDGVFWK